MDSVAPQCQSSASPVIVCYRPTVLVKCERGITYAVDEKKNKLGSIEILTHLYLSHISSEIFVLLYIHLFLK